MVFSDILPIILGETTYYHTQSKPSPNWAPLFEDTSLVTPVPDFYDGLRPSPENKLLRQHLNKFIVPAVDGPSLPNFFFEGKSPNGTSAVVMRQALHFGALGCRGIYHVRAFTEGDRQDGRAHTFSFTFVNGTLKLYAHFLRQSQGSATEFHYHMCPLGAWTLENSAEDVRRAIIAFRNFRDEAARIRNELAQAASQKLQALKHAGQLPPAPVPPVCEIPIEKEGGQAGAEAETGSLSSGSSDELANNSQPKRARN